MRSRRSSADVGGTARAGAAGGAIGVSADRAQPAKTPISPMAARVAMRITHSTGERPLGQPNSMIAAARGLEPNRGAQFGV